MHAALVLIDEVYGKETPLHSKKKTAWSKNTHRGYREISVDRIWQFRSLPLAPDSRARTGQGSGIKVVEKFKLSSSALCSVPPPSSTVTMISASTSASSVKSLRSFKIATLLSAHFDGRMLTASRATCTYHRQAKRAAAVSKADCDKPLPTLPDTDPNAPIPPPKDMPKELVDKIKTLDEKLEELRRTMGCSSTKSKSKKRSKVPDF